MANSFLKGTQIAAQALGLLERELVLPRLVTRYGKSDFIGQVNDTVVVRVPSVVTARDYEWRTRNSPIVIDDLTERSVTVQLNKHPYSAVAITDEQLTLDIMDFGFQVTRPQVRGVAEKLEGYVAAQITAGPYSTDMIVTGASGAAGRSDGQAYQIATKARTALNKQNVPLAGRVLLLGADVEELFLNDKFFVAANASGTTDALRDSFLGRIAGFDVYLSLAIPAGEAYAFHSTAFAFANVAPDVPAGVPDGASLDLNGLAMRWIRDYDPNFLRDRAVVSSFAGTATTLDGIVGTATVTNKALTANVATLTTAAAHNFTTGQVVTVSISDPVFDGTYTITGTPSTTTFTYARTNANVVSAAASGTATVAGKLVRAVKIVFTATA